CRAHCAHLLVADLHGARLRTPRFADVPDTCARDRHHPASRSCTSILRLISTTCKPGNISSFLHLYEGVSAWSPKAGSMASYQVTGVRHPGTPCIIRRRETHGPQRGSAPIPVPHGCTPDEAHAISPSSVAPAAVINPLHGGLLSYIKGTRGRAAQC